MRGLSRMINYDFYVYLQQTILILLKNKNINMIIKPQSTKEY